MNYNAALAHFPKITYQRYKKLINHFNSLPDLWQAKIEGLIKAGIEENVGYEFILWREQDSNSVEKITEDLARENITTVSLGDDNYPRLLVEIADPPHTLFTRGILPPNDQAAIAVVGTRRCTAYGKQMTEKFSTDLAGEGIVIVSGLALGIDGIAHESALNARGQTIAVLGSGINRRNIYPAAHQQLAERIIAEGGAVISEYPPGFSPTQYSFPARNRIIAGLSLGTLITEAPIESGALITAKCALDYNREVFAIPHPLTSPAGEGNNKLIKMGAKLVSSLQDILEELQIQNLKKIVVSEKILPSTPNEAKILSHLSREPLHIDALIKLSGLSSADLNSTLVMMEIKNKIKNTGGMMYTLR